MKKHLLLQGLIVKKTMRKSLTAIECEITNCSRKEVYVDDEKKIDQVFEPSKALCLYLNLQTIYCLLLITAAVSLKTAIVENIVIIVSRNRMRRFEANMQRKFVQCFNGFHLKDKYLLINFCVCFFKLSKFNRFLGIAIVLSLNSLIS